MVEHISARAMARSELKEKYIWRKKEKILVKTVSADFPIIQKMSKIHNDIG